MHSDVGCLIFGRESCQVKDPRGKVGPDFFVVVCGGFFVCFEVKCRSSGSFNCNPPEGRDHAVSLLVSDLGDTCRRFLIGIPGSAVNSRYSPWSFSIKFLEYISELGDLEAKQIPTAFYHLKNRTLKRSGGGVYKIPGQRVPAATHIVFILKKPGAA